MADEKLVAELAAVMHAALDAPGCSCSPAARLMFETCATAVEQWLAERGRLVPDGASVEQQCGLLHSDGDATSVTQCEVAREIASVGAGQHAHRTVITTPWVAVQPEPAQEATDGQR